MTASMEDLLNVDDVGEVIADSIFDFFNDEANKDLVARLRNAGLKFEIEEGPKQPSKTLEGKTIVISGNFSISRDEMKALIVAHGGKNSGSISGKTSFLLAGEKAGPEKLKKADSLGIRIISESEFYNEINIDSPSDEVVTTTTSDEPTLF